MIYNRIRFVSFTIADYLNLSEYYINHFNNNYLIAQSTSILHRTFGGDLGGF